MAENQTDYLRQLRDQVAKSFDEEELRALVFDLGLDWDELQGTRKTARVQDLIVQLGRNGRLSELVDLLRAQRPHLSWPNPPSPEQQYQDSRTAFPIQPFYEQLWFWGAVTTLLIIIIILFIALLPRGITTALIISTSAITQTPSKTPTLTSTPTATLAPSATPTPTITPSPTATPLPFLREAEGETLIVIATFRRTEGVADVNIPGEIYRAIQDKLDELGVENVRVEIEPTAVDGRNRETAEALGKRYNASMIIWGTDTGVRLEVNFLNLREPDSDAAEATLSETERTQLARPDDFAQLVVEDLPNQITFLTLFATGQSFVLQDDFEPAITLIQEAVNLLPDFDNLPQGFEPVAAYFRLAWLYQVTGQDVQAILNYDQVIALNPQYALAFYNRGNAYYNQGQYETAIADYDQAIVLNPRYALAFYYRGNAYAHLDQYETAIADYDQAIALNPQYALAFNNRGNAYYNQGQYETAIADYDQAIALNPQYANAFIGRGLAYANQGQYETAIADYDQAIALNPQDPLAFYYRGNAYRNQGEYETAIADYGQAIALNPQYAPAFNNLCWLSSLLGSAGDVKEACANAVFLAPTSQAHAAYLDSRGLNSALLGDYDAAIADFEGFVEFFQDTPGYEPYVEKRIAWIEALREGNNPFDSATLEALLNE